MDRETRTDRVASDVSGLMTPLLLTPEQAAASLGICRTRVYQLMSSGRLESVQIGTSRRIAMAALEEFVERLRSSAA
jgi:excisionase family DNA binding protein